MIAAPLLQADGLDIRIGRRLLLAGLSLQVQPGERWCVLGPNGAGKTRLIETLAGLHLPAAGAIHYQGQALGTLRVRQAARLRALLPQHSQDAFDASVFELACSGRHPHLAGSGWESTNDHAAVHAALAEFELEELSARAVHSLSGGERQRLALATVLAQETPLLLLDEPLNHLDLRQQQAVLATLSRVADQRRAGLLCSLHDLDAAQAMASHVILLDGRGGHCSGPAPQILTVEALEHAFGVRLECLDQRGRRHWIVAA